MFSEVQVVKIGILMKFWPYTLMESSGGLNLDSFTSTFRICFCIFCCFLSRFRTRRWRRKSNYTKGNNISALNLLFPSFYGSFPPWIQNCTRLLFTGCSIATSCSTVFSTIHDYLNMQSVPFFSEKNSFKIFLSLFHILTICKFPSLSQSMHMRVHRKSWVSKSLTHNNWSSLMTNSR